MTLGTTSCSIFLSIKYVIKNIKPPINCILINNFIIRLTIIIFFLTLKHLYNIIIANRKLFKSIHILTLLDNNSAEEWAVIDGHRLEIMQNNVDNSAELITLFTGQSWDARQRRHGDRILQLRGRRRSSSSCRLRGGQGRIQSTVEHRRSVCFGYRGGGRRWCPRCSERLPENVLGLDTPHQSKL